jgi:archaemetzincin
VRFLALAAAGAVDAEALEVAAASLARHIGVTALRTDPLPEPTFAYDAARRQYSSPALMQAALARVPDGAEKFLVLTEADTFIPMLSFVFGQAQLNGTVAVLSLARLRPEFHGLAGSRKLFLVRVAKEAIHEVGHTYGLTHCLDVRCAMSLSTNLRQLDAKGAAFCRSCAMLIGEAVRTGGLGRFGDDGGEA